MLKKLLVGYDRLFGFSLPYMMVMHQAPTDGGDYEGVAHFHVEFYPPNRTEDKLQISCRQRDGGGGIRDGCPAREDRRDAQGGRRRHDPGQARPRAVISYPRGPDAPAATGISEERRMREIEEQAARAYGEQFEEDPRARRERPWAHQPHRRAHGLQRRLRPALRRGPPRRRRGGSRGRRLLLDQLRRRAPAGRAGNTHLGRLPARGRAGPSGEGGADRELPGGLRRRRPPRVRALVLGGDRGGDRPLPSTPSSGWEWTGSS